MLKKILLGAVTGIIVIGLAGCGGPSVPTQDTVVVPTNKNLTFQESKEILNYLSDRLVLSNNCVVARQGMRSKKSRRSYTATYEQCFRIKNDNIIVLHKGYKPEYVFKYRSKEYMTSIDNKVQRYTNTIREDYPSLSKEYLKLKQQIVSYSKILSSAKADFQVQSKMLHSRSLFKAVKNEISMREVQYFEHPSGYSISTPFNNRQYTNIFMKVNYTPIQIFLAFKESGQQDLKRFIFGNLKIARLSSKLTYNSPLIRFRITADKEIFTYNDLKKPIQLHIQDNTVEANYLFNTFEAKDGEISLKFTLKEYSDNISLANSTTSYINVSAISLYYADDITTTQTKIKLPPKGVVKYSLPLPETRFLPVKNPDKKITFGFAIEYTNLKYSKQNSLLKLQEHSLNDMLNGK